MIESEQLTLYDGLSNAIRAFRGVEQSLRHVGEESNDFEMCQMLSNVMNDEIAKLRGSFPEKWKDGFSL